MDISICCTVIHQVCKRTTGNTEDIVHYVAVHVHNMQCIICMIRCSLSLIVKVMLRQ